MMKLDPIIAAEISVLVTRRSVAQANVEAALHARPYNPDDFRYWVAAHRNASAALIAMGIDVITYDEPHEVAQ
jgi:hypothetical protein